MRPSAEVNKETRPDLFYNGRLRVRYFLAEFAPTFCWCTSWDLYLMAEQVDEDIDLRNFLVQLHNMAHKGWFQVKEGSRAPTYKCGKIAPMYLRIRPTSDIHIKTRRK